MPPPPLRENAREQSKPWEARMTEKGNRGGKRWVQNTQARWRRGLGGRVRAEKDWGLRLLRILRRGLLHKWREGRGGAEGGRVRRMAWRWRVRDWRGGESDEGERRG